MLSSLQRNFIPSLIKNIKKALFISLLFYCYNCEKNNSSSGLILARVKDKELSIEKLEKDLKPKQRSVNQRKKK